MAHPRVDLASPARVPGVTLPMIGLGTSLLVQASEQENPPGEGAILTEALRICQILAGREETAQWLWPERREKRREGRKRRREVLQTAQKGKL